MFKTIAIAVAFSLSAMAAVKIEKTNFKGWPNSYRITNGEIELIVTTDVGPRVMHYGFVGGRNVFKEFRAIKIVHRRSFEDERPYDREFKGIQKFEPLSRVHDSHVDILHVGRNDQAGYFYYVMELADDLHSGQQINPEIYFPKTLKSELATYGRSLT